MHCNEPPVFFIVNQVAENGNNWKTEELNRIIFPVKMCINKEKCFFTF